MMNALSTLVRVLEWGGYAYVFLLVSVLWAGWSYVLAFMVSIGTIAESYNFSRAMAGDGKAMIAVLILNNYRMWRFKRQIKKLAAK